MRGAGIHELVPIVTATFAQHADRLWELNFHCVWTEIRHESKEIQSILISRLCLGSLAT